ncbi:hypothetical protein C7T94_03925 [Pedobacter yulinensis]|uniref:Uncharacterized protein n=1 Tax=Pedobacter yulinensis TaxID=2126353 RepID=A0A2T3HN84_9SPHI|nr:hypothetical protein C7T94_03925 [Pedobacter yulinensis]
MFAGRLFNENALSMDIVPCFQTVIINRQTPPGYPLLLIIVNEGAKTAPAVHVLLVFKTDHVV